MAHRLPVLARRLTGRHRIDPGLVEVTEATGEVCDNHCRTMARRDRARTAAVAAGLGHRI